MAVNFFGVDVVLSAGLVGAVVFAVVVAFTVIITGVMFWHWRKYSMNVAGMFAVEAAYLLGAALFIITAFVELNRI